ncbi:hypothetical protein [Micromonospora fluostatini]|uniref:hypothetical protein n=1 Tax=Micromonospora sp. JCM 30529 TaxID=3421643 RepID=UPI003D165EBE
MEEAIAAAVAALLRLDADREADSPGAWAVTDETIAEDVRVALEAAAGTYAPRNTIGALLAAQRGAQHPSFAASFRFSKALRDPGIRGQMNLAGYEPGYVIVVGSPEELFGGVMRRVARVFAEGEATGVLLVMPDGTGWTMLALPALSPTPQPPA